MFRIKFTLFFFLVLGVWPSISLQSILHFSNSGDFKKNYVNSNGQGTEQIQEIGPLPDTTSSEIWNLKDRDFAEILGE